MGVTRLSLTVVVIGLNEAANLSRCFESICSALDNARSCLGRTTLIYVDSGSTDDSITIASNYADRIFELTATPSAAAARSVGLFESDTDLVLFLDGDMELDNDWLVLAVPELASKPQYVGAIGRRDDIYVDPASGRQTGRRINVCGVKAERTAPHFGGALLAWRVPLVRLGGYDPRLTRGEEPDLHARMRAAGMRVLELPVPFIRHYTPPRASMLERIGIQLFRRSHTYFGITFWKGLLAGYLSGVYQVYAISFLILGYDFLACCLGALAGWKWFVGAQVILTVWLLGMGKRGAVVSVRRQWIAVLATIPWLIRHRRSVAQIPSPSYVPVK